MERKDAIEIVRKLYNESLFLKKDKEAMVTLIPELAESEDERIRKALIRYFTLSDEHAYNEACGVSYRDIVAWLEKQGEQKAKYHDVCDKCVRQPTCQSDCFLQQGKQNPAENKGMNLVEEEMTPFQKKVFCIIDTTIEEEQGLKQVCDELLRLAHDEIMQTPAAWNEEDEKQARQIERIVHNDGCTQKLQKQIADWLKSLKDRVQPKQEWSAEDKKMLDDIIDSGKHACFLTVKQTEWLESLKDRVDCEVNCTTTNDGDKLKEDFRKYIKGE